DGDTVPPANAAEIILTEAYRLHFEGKPAAISPDGRIVQIVSPQGDPARTGDVISILTGPQAGQWRRIAQAIGPATYLLDTPLPPGDYVISIATGFVGEDFSGNTIDARGSSTAAGFVLVGNHYGTSVVGNHILGGGQGFKITAAPTEEPDIWGWSHAPFLGGLIADNVLEDTFRGGTLSVEHSSAIKSDAGRVYFSATVRDNLTTWTDGFLARRNASGSSEPLLAL